MRSNNKENKININNNKQYNIINKYKIEEESIKILK